MRLVPILLLACFSLSATDQDDVVAIVQKTFDLMAAHDGPGIEALFLKDARLIAIRESGESTSTPAADFAARIGAAKYKLIERMWSPQLSIGGRLASLWAPYDFHRDGKRTHCGIDQVNLVKTPEGWRIATLIYTVQTTKCPDSPLGPIN